MQYFINTPYRLIIKTNFTLTDATSLVIEYRGPGSVTGNWTAKPDVTDAYFDIGSSTVTKAGTYKLQIVAEVDGVTRRSGIVQAVFATPL
jgi:hypothetical protein